MLRAMIGCVAVLLACGAAVAEVTTLSVRYADGDVALEGFLALPEGATEAAAQTLPGVLVIHEWWGLGDYAKGRAKQLAERGYVAFAADMYGQGKVTEHPDQAGEWAKAITANREAFRKRAQLGLEVLAQQQMVDPARLAAIGYCFGGATVFELAYSGADVRAVVGFHGSLPTPAEGDVANIKATILACHGANDPMVSDDKVAAFVSAMKQAQGVDWMLIQYGGAMHSFTVPGAESRNIPGIAYNAAADERSWSHAMLLLSEKLAAPAAPAAPADAAPTDAAQDPAPQPTE